MENGDYVDDATISNDQLLWRRIRPDQVVEDDNLKRDRPTSSAFTGDEMSVILVDSDVSMSRALAGSDQHGLVAFSAGLARELGQKVVRDPTADEPNHALVIGKKSGMVRSRLAKDAEWVLRPRQP